MERGLVLVNPLLDNDQISSAVIAAGAARIRMMVRRAARDDSVTTGLVPMRSIIAISCLGTLVLATGLSGGATASDLASCASVEDDSQRLACYDRLAQETLTGEASQLRADARDESAERERIVSRCREEMGQHGSAMVKYCVDEDLASYSALQRYPEEYRAFIERCEREMGLYGWSMVKYCADEDISAERALNDLMAN